VNEQIRAPKVRVVDENGKQLGVFITAEAIRMARSRGYDLVEVAPTADPPVCRFIDYDKFRYEMAKKAKEAKRNQTIIEVKEIRLRLGTDVHDLETKMKKIREFLEEGNKVKVTCVLEAVRGLLKNKFVRNYCPLQKSCQMWDK